MEKELLEQALNSILHGSTQIISRQDSSGNIQQEAVRVNDLRVPLVEKLAGKLVQTESFQKIFERLLSEDVVKKMQEGMLRNVTFADLPYSLRRKIELQMMEAGIEVRKYKVIVEQVVE